MLNLPYCLTRHFQDAAGNFDHQALLRTPDYHLVALARQLTPQERVDLYWRLRGLRLSWVEKMMAQAAGVDINYQRVRFLRVLEEADRTAGTPEPAPAPSFSGC